MNVMMNTDYYSSDVQAVIMHHEMQQCANKGSEEEDMGINDATFNLICIANDL